MIGRSSPTLAIWLVCLGIGLLFLARGAFQPYFFPLFEHLEGLPYGRVALLMNGYVIAQALGAPLAGWYTDRTSVRVALSTAIFLGFLSFITISWGPGFLASAGAVLGAGLAFVLGRVSLNTILVTRSSAEVLRRSVAKRATLLNLGSFAGNSVAVEVIGRLGYRFHALFLALLYLPLAIGLGAGRDPSAVTSSPRWGMAGVGSLCRNRAFLADALRRFAIVLPYGCWGTIIPKFVIDQWGSNEKVWIVYLTSVCTTVIGAHFLAVKVTPWVYQRGFKWEWWSVISVVFYCSGLLLLTFARHLVLLPVAVAVFICGEVVMSPCLDESAKKHGSDSGVATCLGLLNLVDGLGRFLGSAFALAVYAWMRHSPCEGYYWPAVVAAYGVVCTALHVRASVLARGLDAVQAGGLAPEGGAAGGEG